MDTMTKTAKTKADRAIDESIARNRIVTLPYDASTAVALSLKCDDSVDCRSTWGEMEYWGTDDDGATWRVHLYGEGR